MPRVTVASHLLNELDRDRTCPTSLVARPEVGSGEIWVVVVDGSVRSFHEMAAEFLLFRILVEQTPDSSAARNTEATIAKCGFLAFIDSDCVAEPDRRSSIVEVIQVQQFVVFTFARSCFSRRHWALCSRVSRSRLKRSPRLSGKLILWQARFSAQPPTSSCASLQSRC